MIQDKALQRSDSIVLGHGIKMEAARATTKQCSAKDSKGAGKIEPGKSSAQK